MRAKFAATEAQENITGFTVVTVRLRRKITLTERYFIILYYIENKESEREKKYEKLTRVIIIIIYT